jgi:hypothetical protein
MRLFINATDFISVISNYNGYSCQIMELIHGMGMYQATLIDEEQSDIVSGIVYENETYSKTNLFCDTIDEIFNYHQKCITEYYKRISNNEKLEYEFIK